MLYHFSEDDTIDVFAPRASASFPELPPVVWTIDAKRAPMYYLPRECPRIAFSKSDDSNAADTAWYDSQSCADMVLAVESAWLDRIRTTELYVYEFEHDGFTCFDRGAGYYITHETVYPTAVRPVGDLLAALEDANVEIRVTPSLFNLRDALLDSTLQFSMIRMRNAGLQRHLRLG